MEITWIEANPREGMSWKNLDNLSKMALGYYRQRGKMRTPKRRMMRTH